MYRTAQKQHHLTTAELAEFRARAFYLPSEESERKTATAIAAALAATAGTTAAQLNTYKPQTNPKRLTAAVQRLTVAGWTGLQNAPAVNELTDGDLIDAGEDVAHWPAHRERRQLILAGDEELSNMAKQISRSFHRSTHTEEEMEELAYRAHFAGICATAQDINKKEEVKKRLEQLGKVQFWTRQLRKLRGQDIEHLCHCKHLISHAGQLYCSRFALAHRTRRIQQMQNFIDGSYLHDNEGGVIALADVAVTPERQHALRLATIKGMQDECKSAGLYWVMLTLTAPGGMHSTPRNGSKAWNAQRPTPLDAHRYISDQFKLFKQYLADNGVKFCLIRVVEPHRDGCPHWHVLLWHNAKNPNSIREAMDKYFPHQVPARDNAKKQAKRMVVGNDKKGDAVGYLLKYLTKHSSKGDTSHISKKGKKVDRKLMERLAEISRSVDAWRAIYGIRSFQASGLPRGIMTIWNQLGRTRARPDTEAAGRQWDAVKAGDFAHLLRSLGNVKPIQERDCEGNVIANIDAEILTDDKKGYRRVIGIRIDGWEKIKTKEWRQATDIEIMADPTLKENIEKLQSDKAAQKATPKLISEVIHKNPRLNPKTEQTPDVWAAVLPDFPPILLAA